MITRNRAAFALRAIERLRALPEQPPIVVVDNGSDDGTPRAVTARYPEVNVVSLAGNEGAAGRTHGVRAAETPYVAFADDDSWWAAGSLARAAERFARCPRLGLVAARVLVGPDERDDEINTALAAGPVLGFLACGAAVRREAFLAVGGFHPAYGVGGEEHLVALDLAAAGWDLAYAPDVVAHHHPEPTADRVDRRARQLRNDLWSAWLRHPLDLAARRTARLARRSVHDPAAKAALIDAARGLPWVLSGRRALPPAVEADLRLVVAGRRGAR